MLTRQRETLEAFDRYNEVEATVSLGTRKGYLDTLHELGVSVRKPFEEMTKKDLQNYIHYESIHYEEDEEGKVVKSPHKEGTIQLYKQHIKRFFKWLEWVKVNKGKRDENIWGFFLRNVGIKVHAIMFCSEKISKICI